MEARMAWERPLKSLSLLPDRTWCAHTASCRTCPLRRGARGAQGPCTWPGPAHLCGTQQDGGALSPRPVAGELRSSQAFPGDTEG